MAGRSQVDASDELTKPLGQARPEPKPSRLPGAARAAVVGLAALPLGALALAAVFGDPDGGRPLARVDIVARPVAAPSPPPPAPAGQPNRRDAETVEAESGVSVVRPAGTAPPGSVVVRVPEDGAGGLAPSPDPRLVEKTRSGLVPRVGPDGSRAVDVYARPAGSLPGGVQPLGRIAIVVGGLGIARGVTEDAIAELPPAVSLAFAPYGRDLPQLAARARAAGHELLVQIPMEPFDYPDSDPGPHTLKAGAPAAENLDHLHWALGRFSGYVGIMNYMGGKLTSTDRALAPVLREAGQRGLGVLDDGSSSRSRIVALAGDMPAARADAVLDATPRADLIDGALQKLAEQALSSDRIVIGTASAFPATVARIKAWAQGLEARGILLVPASAALSRGPVRESEAR